MFVVINESIDQIRQTIISEGYNPDDYIIDVRDNGFSYYPIYNPKIRKAFEKGDKPIKEDVNDVALSTAYILEDTMTTAETVAFLLLEIASLKAEIETLKGGKF